MYLSLFTAALFAYCMSMNVFLYSVVLDSLGYVSYQIHAVYVYFVRTRTYTNQSTMGLTHDPLFLSVRIIINWHAPVMMWPDVLRDTDVCHPDFQHGVLFIIHTTVVVFC